MPQRLALLDTLTVQDNIALADADRAAEVPALAASLAVDHLLDRFPGEISLGERQRVGLARALHARAPSRSSTSRPRTRTATTPAWCSTPDVAARRPRRRGRHPRLDRGGRGDRRRSPRGGRSRELNSVHLPVRQQRQGVQHDELAWRPRPRVQLGHPGPRLVERSARRPRTPPAASPTPRRDARAPRPRATAGCSRSLRGDGGCRDVDAAGDHHVVEPARAPGAGRPRRSGRRPRSGTSRRRAPARSAPGRRRTRRTASGPEMRSRPSASVASPTPSSATPS